ncbi:MAG: hydrogenase formation protein HypD [Planctomycetia bacterium]|nr:hydrogenase formation protein HypD [Planctomycetia bacterium]
MKTNNVPTAKLLEQLHASAAAVKRPIAFMEVCGTHTTSAFRCGLPSVMPGNVRLISGPGCPVCVTAQADIDRLIELGSRHDVILCTYGDMLRVPGSLGTLEKARMNGSRIEVVYSSMDAVQLARREPDSQVVFAAVGFETTAPATAAAICEAHRLSLKNFSVLASHKLIIPAMRALLKSTEAPRINGFLCPGHVSVIIGADAYRPIVDEFGVACVIGGFEPEQIISALLCLTDMVQNHQVRLVNEYPEAVHPKGNRWAIALLDQIFQPGDARWRGMGVIPQSGLVLRPDYERFDAARRFALAEPEEREPAGCLCGKVISGAALPTECRLFGRACTPVSPIGPCMVSAEGTCSAWFKYGALRNMRARPSPKTSLAEVIS